MTKRKLFLLIVVFILYEVLVWLGALLFLADSSLLVGFVLTVCGLTVLSVYVLVARLSAAHSAAPPVAAPAVPASAPEPSAPSPGPRTPGSNAGSELIREANEQLARSPKLASQRVKNTITDFPLYFVVGSEGSGKTSLFLASGFQPELLAGQVHRDSVVVPTRLGNIWFADGAVVVEAAGDLFSGEASRWSDFVASFPRPGGKSRFARIFGGNAETRLGAVLLCCDAGALVGVPDSARLAAMGRLVQQRLRVVGETFGRDFPVYVIFTKSDSIPYFGEYFGRLAESEDTKVLGCVFPGTDASSETKDTLTAGLNKLYLSLADKRLEFLEREKATVKRPAIYEFPREFKRLRGPLVQFLVDIFRVNPLQPNPRLLGVFFTGTRKVLGQTSDLDHSVIHKVGDVTRILRAEDLQRLRSTVSETREREPEITRWSFVANLWQQILARRPAAEAGLYINQRQQFYRKLAVVSVAAVCGLATLLFFNSFLRNYFLVTRVQAAALQTEPVRAGTAPSTRNLQEIEELRTEVEALVENRPGLFMHFGFYDGGQLTDPAWRVYYRRFREYFLNPVVHRLEDQLAALPPEPNASYRYDTVYANLQTYRTITRSPQEASCKADSGLRDRMQAVWRQDRPSDPESERIARANFQFFVSSLKSGRIPDELQIASQDSRVVQPGRTYLRTFKGAEPQYLRIIEQVNRDLPSARLADLTHNTNYRSVMRVQEEVPAAFTRSGWNSVQQLIESAAGGNASESCVLGSGGGPVAGLLAGADIKTQIRQMYIDEYIRTWKGFLASASVLPYTGCKDAAEKLRTLKDNNSPLLAVLVLASANTTFPPNPRSKLSQVAGRSIDTVSKGSKWHFGKSQDAAKAATGSKAFTDALTGGGPTEDEITAAFQPAHAVFESSPPNLDRWHDTRNTPYLDSLGDLQRAFEALVIGGKCDDTNLAANNQANAELGKAHGALDALARNFDNRDAYDSVKVLLGSPLQKDLIKTDPGGAVKGKINRAQQQLCSGFSIVKNKYPFNPQGDDADMEQVTKVFDPKDGLLAGLREALGDLVVKSGGSWTQKPDAPVKLPRGFLESLNRMSAISDALFPRPVKYRLSVRQNPAVKQVSGKLDGEPVSMSVKEYVWPAGTVTDLRVEPIGSTVSSALRSYSSIWGIFQLLGDADRIAGTNQFQLVNVQGGKRSNPQPILPDGSAIVLEVTEFPNGVSQAFDKGFFKASCPPRIEE